MLAARRRTADWGSSLALRKPSWTRFTFWITVYLLWMLFSDVLFHWRGPWDFTAWREHSLLHNTGRVVAVCLLGPIAEELGFRGLIFHAISNSRLGTSGAVLLTSVAWSCLHFQYDRGVILLIALRRTTRFSKDLEQVSLHLYGHACPVEPLRYLVDESSLLESA